MSWNVERRIREILVNRENIEDVFTHLNKTKHRVKKLERLTEGVNSMNKNYNYDDSIKRLYDITNNYSRRLDRIEERLDGSRTDYSARGNRRNRVARRTGRRRRGGRRTRGGARTKKNTPFFTDPKTLKKVINPSFVKSKPQPVTLNITGVGPVTFDPKEVAQQRRMMTQHKKLSPTGRKNRGGRRKKRTRRRKSRGKSRRRMRGKRKGKTRRKK